MFSCPCPLRPPPLLGLWLWQKVVRDRSRKLHHQSRGNETNSVLSSRNSDRATSRPVLPVTAQESGCSPSAPPPPGETLCPPSCLPRDVRPICPVQSSKKLALPPSFPRPPPAQARSLQTRGPREFPCTPFPGVRALHSAGRTGHHTWLAATRSPDPT